MSKLSLLLVFIIMGCNSTDPIQPVERGDEAITRINPYEYCYRGFVYRRMMSGYVPAFNKYGTPLRCPKEMMK